jgi:hypothetical protein
MWKVKLQNLPGETENQYKAHFQIRDVPNSNEKGQTVDCVIRCKQMRKTRILLTG